MMMMMIMKVRNASHTLITHVVISYWVTRTRMLTLHCLLV